MNERPKTISEKTICKNAHFVCKEDVYQIADGHETVYHYVVRSGTVVVIPTLPDGRIVMTRQYRYLQNKESIEFPSGSLRGEETASDAATRELKEETGYTVDELIKIGEVEPSNGCMRNPTHIYLSFVSEQGEQQLDETELIEVVYRRPDEVDQMVERNDIWDSLTISAWAMARPRILHTEPYV